MTLVTRDEIRSRSATPPVSGMTLSARMVIIWHRGKTKVNRLLGNPLSETRAAHESTCRLPYEFVEMIIAHLAHDLDALKACSLACRSWHTVAVPHLHHTLTLRREKPSLTHDGTSPPSARDKLKPLSKLHDLGLISVVEEIRVEQRVEGWSGINTWFVPHEFNRRDLRYFSTFTNVRTLRLQNLEIYRFVPNIERYFGHFSPTLRSIALFEPRCTPRQLSYILSLFSNLENIEIEGTAVPDKTIPETVLVPFSAPKLRGRLALYDFDWVETWTHLITSCGGLRFRHLDLRGSASCVSVLLEACSGTLETLRINATDGSIGIDSPPSGFNLSRLKVLRSLQVGGWLGGCSPDHHTAVVEVFTSITSPVFSELVIAHTGYAVTNLLQEVTLFEVLRKMNGTRSFKLVFLLEPSDLYQENLQELAETLESVTANGLLDFLDSPPIIR